MHHMSHLDWSVNFNGDFSGDVRLVNPEKKIEVWIPFDVLKAVVAEFVRHKRISQLETCKDDEAIGL